MSHSVLISTFFRWREAALERVALAADADVGDDDAIVRAADASVGLRRDVEELAAERYPRPPLSRPAW